MCCMPDSWPIKTVCMYIMKSQLPRFNGPRCILRRSVNSPPRRTKGHLAQRCCGHETKLTFVATSTLRRFNYGCRQITSLPPAWPARFPPARLACTNYCRSVSQMWCGLRRRTITKLSSSLADAVELEALVAAADAHDDDDDKKDDETLVIQAAHAWSA